MQSKEQEKTVFASKEDLVGKILGGKYEVLKLLGKGGMSAVFKVKHIVLGKEYAIKVMHSHLVADDNALARFKQEAAAACALSHPNIISVHDFDQESGQPYQAIDYLEGISLADAIRAHGKLEPERALPMFIQAASALSHAHSKGVIHRDLKPSNIMLITQDGQPDFVKIVDFGIAKVLPQEGEAIQQLTQTGEVFGSPLYMSPEQCLGNKLDGRSDIYQMGCLMYETLTGSPPLVGETVFETIQKHIDEVPKSIIDILPPSKVVESLSQVIAKSLAKSPQHRQQNMDELLSDLIHAQQGQSDTFFRAFQKKFHLAAIRIEPLRKHGVLKAYSWVAITAALLFGTIGCSFQFALSGPVPPYAPQPWPQFTSEAEVSKTIGKNSDALGTAQIALDSILTHISLSTTDDSAVKGLISVAVAYGQNGQYDDAARLADRLHTSLITLAAHRSGHHYLPRQLSKNDLPDMLQYFAPGSSRIDAFQCLTFIGDACYMQKNWTLADFYYSLAEEQLAGESNYARQRVSMKHADALLNLNDARSANTFFLLSTNNTGKRYEKRFFTADDDAFCPDRATWMSKVGDTLAALEDYNQAVLAYSGATAEWSKDKDSLGYSAQVLVNMAHCYEKLNQPANAENALERAAKALSETNDPKLKNNLPAIWNEIAQLRSKEHNYFGWLQAAAHAHGLGRVVGR